jgi:hypothetical protein
MAGRSTPHRVEEESRAPGSAAQLAQLGAAGLSAAQDGHAWGTGTRQNRGHPARGRSRGKLTREGEEAHSR